MGIIFALTNGTFLEMDSEFFLVQHIFNQRLSGLKEDSFSFVSLIPAFFLYGMKKFSQNTLCIKTQRFSLTIAIPAYNEKDSIGEVAREALLAAQKYTSEYEILLVDDG